MQWLSHHLPLPAREVVGGPRGAETLGQAPTSSCPHPGCGVCCQQDAGFSCAHSLDCWHLGVSIRAPSKQPGTWMPASWPRAPPGVVRVRGAPSLTQPLLSAQRTQLVWAEPHPSAPSLGLGALDTQGKGLGLWGAVLTYSPGVGWSTGGRGGRSGWGACEGIPLPCLPPGALPGQQRKQDARVACSHRGQQPVCLPP